MTLIYFLIPFSKPKPSKKAKANKPTAETAIDDPAVDPDTTVPPEGERTIPLEDPAPMDHATAPENPNTENVHEPASPARADPPQTSTARASPVHTATPPPATAPSPDVQITGTAYTAPAEPAILAKHTAKAEKIHQEKGKWSTELSGFADLSAQELYSGYLNRLHTGRDYEASLISMMKEKYDVTPLSLFYFCCVSVHTMVAPKFRFSCI